MNILNVEHISKIYGEKVIFDDVSLGIHHGDKIGIIGVNGTGKSTLLKIIAGLEEPDQGEIICGNGIRISYLPQNPEFSGNPAILSYVMEGKAHQDWQTESEAKTILTKLGIFDFEEKTEYLSGGQRKRVALARTLVDPTEILVLDEPTNHLDHDMVSWLEEYLGQFKGVLIMVTHDRYFLDRVTNKIVEIDKGKLYEYDANYSRFLELKVQREEMEMASERKRQSLLRVEMEWMKQGIKARGTRQRARTERFEALKNAKGPEIRQNVEIDSVSSRLGKKTIEFSHVSKGFNGHKLISDFSYIVLRDDRLGFIGPNGCGKSTLMKMLTGSMEPDEGEIIKGETIKIGYFAQENRQMEGDIRVIDYIRDTAEYIQTARGQASASQMLERFLFPPELQYTPLCKLSGGEKRRLYLLKVLMEAPNVLILDEPTNDLDIATLTILEDYLDSFQGIVITVSHDRYFLDRIVNRIFAFEEGGKLRQYEGGYTDYLEKSRKEEALVEKKEKKPAKKFQKEHQKKLKFTFKEQKEYETIDDEIASLEEKLEKLDQEIMENATNSGKLAELTAQKEETEQQLEGKMDRWVYLNDLAERIEQQNK
ncbi:MAG TPA: ABC-F family ATP-binding cassette domain-containing protein [Candidatus Anaerostipes avistercoris]|uniref:ABC-F family ATP-binding cassette domain-containing protein n=1 Tax=Candidatus Anaerostipes avistercoris TaxID=2838462 RepID=A0A9D2PG81_9FIRM|nr:ABC-F family ATP-binding cassette domain-containing protein [Candidatus Anaerostipes avistercoris]